MPHHGPDADQEHIRAVRRFNRFYTNLLGLLNERIYGPEASLTEARVLWEIDRAPGIRAAELTAVLSIDRGYLSRILERFARRGVLSRTPDSRDGRVKRLAVTDAGHELLARLKDMSEGHIAGLLHGLDGLERAELVWAMGRIESILGAASERATGPDEDGAAPDIPEPTTD